MLPDKQSTNWVYMLRTTQQHHVHLTSLIDQKANILIASSSIILTYSFSHIHTAKHFWGFWLLMITAFLTLLTSILVIAPISFRKGKSQNPKGQKNILFFGHFAASSYEDFESEILEVMDDAERVKRSMVRDIYDIGRVLYDRKHPFLKASSTIFFMGLVVSIAVFTLEYVFGKVV